MILGAAVPIAGLLLFRYMLGAFLFVHAGNGVFVTTGGFELVMALGAASLLLAVTGAGRFSLDALLTSRPQWRQSMFLPRPPRLPNGRRLLGNLGSAWSSQRKRSEGC